MGISEELGRGLAVCYLTLLHRSPASSRACTILWALSFSATHCRAHESSSMHMHGSPLHTFIRKRVDPNIHWPQEPTWHMKLDQVWCTIRASWIYVPTKCLPWPKAMWWCMLFTRRSKGLHKTHIFKKSIGLHKSFFLNVKDTIFLANIPIVRRGADHDMLTN
jgi:hypothetical protein